MPRIARLHAAHSTSIFTQGCFAPLLALFVRADRRHACLQLTAQDWLCGGVLRAIEDRADVPFCSTSPCAGEGTIREIGPL